jgi:prepilin-type N-terminal cleavage/methylation domain-containing protein
MNTQSMIDQCRSTGLRSRRAGFTAVEVLIVAVVLLIIGSMAYPQMASRVMAGRADNAARMVASDLRMAVALASRQGMPIRVEFDASAQELRLINRAGTVVHQRAFGSDSEFPVESMNASANITVFPNRLASAQFIVQFHTPTRSTQVRMTRATLIKVEQL